MTKLKILHLNIEKNNHLESVRELLQKENPDVACFAEAMRTDIIAMGESLGYHVAFAPMVHLKREGYDDQEGLALFSRGPIENERIYRYDANDTEQVPVEGETYEREDTLRPASRFLNHAPMLVVDIREGASGVSIATTHFPVVDHEHPDLGDHTMAHMSEVREIIHARSYFDRLLDLIDRLDPSIIFTADLNNARGEYIYDTLAHILVDRVPDHIQSTIDPNLHRKQGLQMVVDTIMTSPQIQTDDVVLIEGVSDHQAILATMTIMETGV